MRSMLDRSSSPAMGVAFFALLAALGGTAVALPGKNTVDSGDIKNAQVKTQDIRNNTVRGKDIRTGTVTGSDVRDNTLTGADINESTLSTVPSANSARTANTANTANTAESTAFARINADGTVDTARSKGITSANVNKDAPGHYCISGLGFTPKAVAGVVARSGNIAGVLEASTAPPFSDCGPPTQVEVFTRATTTGAQQDFSKGFYLIFN